MFKKIPSFIRKIDINLIHKIRWRETMCHFAAALELKSPDQEKHLKFFKSFVIYINYLRLYKE